MSERALGRRRRAQLLALVELADAVTEDWLIEASLQRATKSWILNMVKWYEESGCEAAAHQPSPRFRKRAASNATSLDRQQQIHGDLDMSNSLKIIYGAAPWWLIQCWLTSVGREDGYAGG